VHLVGIIYQNIITMHGPINVKHNVLLSVVSAVLVCSGAAVYPVGWDNREVLESCGNVSSVYNLGR